MAKGLQELLNKLKARYFNALSQRTLPQLEALNKIPQEKLLLPPEVAQNPSEEIGPQRLVLNFEYFNEDACKFDGFDSAKIKSLLNKLAEIAKHTSATIISSGLIHDHVFNNGDYQALFNKLDKDVEKLCEFEISGYGRFYGFVIENNFYFVALDAIHKNTH
ncbi:hypothetical protein COU01_02045 [Candidatus Falkowbacteria bacterium CG10_big_fil_rev_8_21_14_0_10_44_15]|uniref:Uncharacterized protein n=1 Tax=Candidatus Falkowbacteria bacterium CG10_big_fil_rev_8_21_14_0_10_44_15 TaxID=1974569 RepID=A0A2H0V1S4_9BACT|nr:MAG: hypothetical protein COU01_02045 [Candidatus Falkowbacteria bacterium CG10_big_fil_rev_8_21_14_0_10_44_15]